MLINILSQIVKENKKDGIIRTIRIYPKSCIEEGYYKENNLFATSFEAIKKRFSLDQTTLNKLFFGYKHLSPALDTLNGRHFVIYSHNGTDKITDILLFYKKFPNFVENDPKTEIIEIYLNPIFNNFTQYQKDNISRLQAIAQEINPKEQPRINSLLNILITYQKPVSMFLLTLAKKIGLPEINRREKTKAKEKIKKYLEILAKYEYIDIEYLEKDKVKIIPKNF